MEDMPVISSVCLGRGFLNGEGSDLVLSRFLPTSEVVDTRVSSVWIHCDYSASATE